MINSKSHHLNSKMILYLHYVILYPFQANRNNWHQRTSTTNSILGCNQPCLNILVCPYLCKRSWAALLSSSGSSLSVTSTSCDTVRSRRRTGSSLSWEWAAVVILVLTFFMLFQKHFVVLNNRIKNTYVS